MIMNSSEKRVAPPALECETLTKRFGGLEAVGCLFVEGTPQEIRNNPQVQEIYFGEEEKPC